jgi:lactoylglutathione lyase
MIKGLTHVAIRVQDVERSVAFYRDVLGLNEHFRLTNEAGAPILVYIRVTASQFIELFPGANEPRLETNASGAVHICLEVDDIQKSFAEMTGRGLEATGQPVLGADNSWQFWTKDPDGNPIEFHQFTPESLQLGNSDGSTGFHG